MPAYRNIVLAGATGNLGPSVLQELKKDPSLSITILCRPNSKAKTTSITETSPEAQTVKTVICDYHLPSYDREALVAALRGADVLVSCIPEMTSNGEIQLRLIDAAIEAGVKRYIPSEFGTNTESEEGKTSELVSMAFGAKRAVREHLAKKAAEGKITWTAIVTGGFLDWGLKAGFLGFDIATSTAIIFDSGNHRISLSILEDIGVSVLNVIKNPSETENRIVFVASAALSQNEILAAFERVTGKKWMVNKASTEEMPEVGKKAIVGGNASEGWLNIVKYILFTDKEELGSNYKAKDNELLGVKTLDAAGIEQVIRGVVGA